MSEGIVSRFPQEFVRFCGYAGFSEDMSDTPPGVEQAAGYTDLQIGERLGLRARTVENHMRHVRAKLGVRTRIEAVLKAWQLGLI